MPKTVLNFPVQLDALSEEPDLIHLISTHYLRFLSLEEATEATLEYVSQIHAAEADLRVEFAKYVISKMTFPKGVIVADLLNDAFKKVTAEQLLRQKAEIKAHACGKEGVSVGGDPHEPTFDDIADVQVVAFDNWADMEAYLNRTYPKNG